MYATVAMRNIKMKPFCYAPQENELSKLRRAIEDQRIKAERVDVLGKPQTNAESVYNFPTSSNNVNNSASSPGTENAYPVFVSPDHDHWSSSAASVSGHINSNSTLTRSNVGKSDFQPSTVSI